MRRVAAVLGFVAAPFLLAALLIVPTGASQLPPIQPDIVQSSQWVCTGAQNRDLVRITMSNGSSDAVQFRTDCSGRIGRLEVQGTFADCLKVNPPEPAPHDMLIESGFCHATGPPSGGVHQDCIQAGGGQNFDIRNFAFDCIGGGGGNYFIAGYNGGSPDNFVCDHCAFGPRHPNQIRTPSSANSGVKNSLVCRSSSGRGTYGPASADLGGNVSPAASDPQCSFAGLMAYVGGSPPPPPPAPECSDGLDNDGDTLIDFPNDPGCEAAGDTSESPDPPPPPPPVQCADGIDNDGDGLVDLADPGCESALDDDETNAPPSDYNPECRPTCDEQIAELEARIAEALAALQD